MTKDIITTKKEESNKTEFNPASIEKNVGVKKKSFAKKQKSFGQKRYTRAEQEYDQKIIDIRRVTRVMAGGRRFSFSVACVIGDKKGRVGVGIGKASDTSLAIVKAARDAKKRLIKVPLNERQTIAHEVSAKYNAAQIIIKPTKGQGVIAGSSVRNVLVLAGIKGVSSKILSRSKNKLNNARAAIKALSQL